MRIRTRSKKRRAIDAIGAYLKFKAIAKATKGARKTIKGLAAYKATKSAAERAPKPVKALPVVAGVGVAGAVAVGKRPRHEETPEPAATAAP
jgi:hypothetical protein